MRICWPRLIGITFGAAAVLGWAPRPAEGQVVTARLGRTFVSPDFLSAWLDYSPTHLGPLHPAITIGSMGHDSGTLYGLGFDLSLGVANRWSVVGGAALGFGKGSESGDWGSWSVGAHYDLIRGRIGLGVQGRYRRLLDPNRSGVEILGVLRIPLGGGRTDSPQPAVASPPPFPPPRGTSAESVVRVARDVMGTPYVWGGSDDNGFDCSGLILYAYGELGVALPRRSVDQARAGQAVPLQIGRLRPADILAFAETGSAVSHVGLYVGNGRFIHSSSRGVRISRLDPLDPEGRWWHTRWVGARRVIDEPSG